MHSDGWMDGNQFGPSLRLSDFHHRDMMHLDRWMRIDWAPRCVMKDMAGNLLTVQSMEMMSYFLFFLATVFGNLEVWKVRK